MVNKFLGAVKRLPVILSILLISLTPEVSARIVDKIIAVVNDEVITQAEIDSVLYPLYMEYAKRYDSEEEILKRLDQHRMEILKQLIHDKLILSQAKKLGITVSNREIDERLDQAREELKGQGMTMNDLLKQQKITMKDLRKRYEEQIMVERTVTQEVRYGVSIQPSELSKYYNDHIEDYSQPEQVAIRTILFKLESERTPDQTKQLAKDVHEMIEEGRSFEDAAKNYTEGPNRNEGGDMGFVRHGELLEEMDSIVFDLDVGEVSDIVKSSIGYHICLVYDKREKSVVPFTEVRERVYEAIYRIKMQRDFEDWLEELKDNAYISIK